MEWKNITTDFRGAASSMAAGAASLSKAGDTLSRMDDSLLVAEERRKIREQEDVFTQANMALENSVQRHTAKDGSINTNAVMSEMSGLINETYNDPNVNSNQKNALANAFDFVGTKNALDSMNYKQRNDRRQESQWQMRVAEQKQAEAEAVQAQDTAVFAQNILDMFEDRVDINEQSDIAKSMYKNLQDLPLSEIKKRMNGYGFPKETSELIYYVIERNQKLGMESEDHFKLPASTVQKALVASKVPEVDNFKRFIDAVSKSTGLTIQEVITKSAENTFNQNELNQYLQVRKQYNQ